MERTRRIDKPKVKELEVLENLQINDKYQTSLKQR